MTDISMSDAELLKFAIEDGMIDAALVQEKVEMQKRKEILDKHPYKIYQGKDEKWYTYLPCDDTRKKIKSTSRDKLEDKVVLFWKDKDDNPTVNEVFYSWISEKLSRGEISKATYDRYLIDFEKYFVKLKELKIKEIDECFLEDFVKDSICQFNMTAKCFSNFRTLIYGIFKFAKRKKYV